MASWDDLTLEAIQIVRNAQDYLDIRRPRAETPQQEAQMEAWSQRLRARSADISTIYVENKNAPEATVVTPDDTPAYTIIAEQLGLTDKQIRSLHETYDFGQVELVLRSLDQHLGNFMSAGPHGPGKGRPKGSLPKPGTLGG